MRTFTKSLAVLLTLTTAVVPFAMPTLVPTAAAALEHDSDWEYTPPTAFTDLDQAAPWARDEINDAHWRGLMSGYPNGEFRPLGPITRQEFASILMRLMYLEAGGTASYLDVPRDSWSAPAIEAVTRAGLMSGDGNGHFRPTAPLTREELSVILVRAATVEKLKEFYPTEVDFTFTDHEQFAPWAVESAYLATKDGLLIFDGHLFRPKQLAQRQEVADSAVSLLAFFENTGWYSRLRDGSTTPNDPNDPNAPDQWEAPEPDFFVQHVTSADREVTGKAPAGSTVKLTSASGTLLGTTTAGADNRFSLALPTQAVGNVLRVTMTDSTGKASEPVTVTVEQAKKVTISGKVLSAGDLSPLSDVRVILEQDGIFAQATRTDHNGEYRFETPPGRYEVHINQADATNLPWYSSNWEDVRYNSTPQTVSDLLATKPLIQGRVLKADGSPAADILVKVAYANAWSIFTYTDQQGRYWLESLAPNYQVIVETETQAQSDDSPSTPYSFVPAANTRTIPDIKLQPADVRGTVRTHTGQPVREPMKLDIYEAQTGQYVTHVTTDENGKYRIKGLTIGKEYQFRQSYNRPSQERFTYRGAGMSLDLTLRKPVVTGKVYKTSAKSAVDLVPNTLVSILKEENRNGQISKGLIAELKTDATGQFSVDLPDGNYLIQAHSDIANLAASAKQKVTVSGGVMRTGNLDLILRKPVVQGVLRDEQGLPVAGARLMGFGFEDGIHFDDTNSRGEYALVDLPTGEHTFHIQSPLNGPYVYENSYEDARAEFQITNPSTTQVQNITLPRDPEHVLARPQVDPVYMNNKTVTGRAEPNRTVHVLLGGHEVGRADTRADGTFSVEWFLPAADEALEFPLTLYVSDDDFNDSETINVEILPAR